MRLACLNYCNMFCEQGKPFCTLTFYLPRVACQVAMENACRCTHAHPNAHISTLYCWYHAL